MNDRPQDPDSLRSAIEASGVTWTLAPEPWGPPPATTGALPGWRASAPVHRWAKLATPPEDIDWRAKAALTPALDQATSNACTSFAIGAVIGDLRRIRSGPAGPAASAAFVHACAAGCGYSQAASPSAVVVALTRLAVPEPRPNDFPYDPAACRGAAGPGVLSGSTRLKSAVEAKWALQQGPIFAVMDLYDDFWLGYGGGIYVHGAGANRGAHAVEVVGYDDPQRHWIVKNSRGTGWAELGGYARIKYGECRLFSDGVNLGGMQLHLA